MPSLADDLRQLLTVQAIDNRADAARARLAALDTGASTVESYNRGKAAFEQERTQAVKAQGAQKEAELNLQTIEDKRKKTDADLYSGKITGGRELANLQAELEMLGRQKSAAEDATLSAMEAAQTAMSTAQAREAQLKALADKHKQIRARYKTEAAALQAEITAHDADRVKAVAPISPPLLSRYDAIRARKGGIGIATLSESGACQVCHTQVSTNVRDAARAALTPTTCESCGRLLTLLPVP